MSFDGFEVEVSHSTAHSTASVVVGCTCVTNDQQAADISSHTLAVGWPVFINSMVLGLDPIVTTKNCCDVTHCDS